MEKEMNIKSSLYDYTVTFIDDFHTQLSKLQGSLTYVIDRNVYGLYKSCFEDIPNDNIFFIDAIESKKNIDIIMELIYFWKEKGVKKNWKVICVGGGITQDITTFACNIYLRNIDWYFFPTTLLAMCDSCIGGKCGINLGQYKNQLGVFYPPKRIFIATEFLRTLTKADYINGWGELIKFSLTQDKAFYEALESESQYIPCEHIAEFIYEGLMVKKRVIEADEFEGDLRRILNYGHTFGHALEAYTNNMIPHGTAVIWGMDVVNYIAAKEGIFSDMDYLRIKRLICNEFLQEEIVIDNPRDLYEILSTDKKVKDNTVYLAVPDCISNLIIYPMELNDKMLGYLVSYLEETHEYYSN